MENNPLFDKQFITFGAHGAIAVLGAITHALVAHRTGKSKGFLDFIILTTMSSFSGIVFALVAFQFFDSPYMTLAITGAGGFLGVEGLTILSGKLREALMFSLEKK
jgi:hypothetical protein